MFYQFTDTAATTIGFGLLMAGLVALYAVGRRRFLRRNVAGLEEFGGFGSMLVTRFLERILQLAGLAAVLMGFLLMFLAGNSAITLVVPVVGQGFVSELEVRTTDLPTVVEAEGVTSVEPASLTGIIWLERPTAPDFARHYPPRALEQRIEARVELDCTSAADGRLSCSVASEEPKGWEFGDATLRLASLFRLAPTTRTGEASAGRSLRLPVMWRIQEAAAAVGPGEIEQPVVGELVTNPRWLEQPSARDFERHYPRDAAARGLEGRALLECSVLRDGRLNCSLVSEEPAGAGFGDAALRLSSSFRAAPTTVDGVATVGRRVRIPLLFRLAD